MYLYLFLFNVQLNGKINIQIRCVRCRKKEELKKKQKQKRKKLKEIFHLFILMRLLVFPLQRHLLHKTQTQPHTYSYHTRM